MQLPPSNLASGGHFQQPPRTFPSNMYSVMEGSPTYKQRRRRSSVTPGIPNPGATVPQSSTTSTPAPTMAYAAHKPSDLRRSMSSSVVPAVTEATSDQQQQHQDASLTQGGGATSYAAPVLPQKDLLQEMSRHGTPLSGLDDHSDPHALSMGHPQDGLGALPNEETLDASVQSSMTNKERYGPGPVRRARSATMMELGPYPQKSHSCPIPSCGRIFKRLEHLKR